MHCWPSCCTLNDQNSHNSKWKTLSQSCDCARERWGEREWGRGRGCKGEWEEKRPLKKSHDLAAVKWAKVRATKGADTATTITSTIAMAMATKSYCKTETETETENRKLKTKN